jgi:hypothetical protein
MLITRTARGVTTTIEIHPLRNLIFFLLFIACGGLFFYWASFSNHPAALLIVGGLAGIFGVAGVQRTIQLMAHAARAYRG